MLHEQNMVEICFFNYKYFLMPNGSLSKHFFKYKNIISTEHLIFVS